ncbi:MAG: hypothetical protein PHE02_08685 [Lachnospiraceae bacterium]|nr:hypothetical protein [Lachnospiraceae bacterium]
MNENDMINEVIRHLDGQVHKNVGRMSVNFTDKDTEKEVSYKCCHMYGRAANETVGLLDMYTDSCVNQPDNEYQSKEKMKQNDTKQNKQNKQKMKNEK